MTGAPAPGERNLPRRIGLWGATAIVVGNVVGSGIFVAPGEVLRALGNVHAALAAWIFGGVLSLFGALAFAELGTAYPHTGGAYVYLRRAFGDRMAFVYGWAGLWIIKPTGAAGIAVVFAQYLHEIWPALTVRAIAVAALVLVYGMNYRSVTASSHTQLALTIAKCTGLAAIAALAVTQVAPVAHPPTPLPELTAWGAALVPILWTYDGWSELNNVAGEIRAPERVIPWSLILGTAAVMALYGVVVLAVHAGVDVASLQSGQPVLTTLARGAWGDAGARAITGLVLLSTFGSLLAGAITTPRTFWAMGRDGLFFAQLGAVHQRFGTPHVAVAAIAVGAIVFVLSGTFDQIITYFVFVMWSFYALTGVALFRLRQLEPGTPRPYRARWYPLGPALFVTASLGMLGSVVFSAWRESLVGLLLVAAGSPAYDLWRRATGRKRHAPG